MVAKRTVILLRQELHKYLLNVREVASPLRAAFNTYAMVPAQAIPFPTLIIALCTSVVSVCALIIQIPPITKLEALRLGRQSLLCFATVAFSSAALVLRSVQSTSRHYFAFCLLGRC
jgi:hypothetical protein